MINSFRRIASSSRTIIIRRNDTNKRWNNHLISNKYGKKIVNYYSTLPINNFHHQMKDSATFERFKLSAAFVDQFADRKPPFGFNGLGELVYRRTYARELENGRMEEWYQTVERVINGTFNMQKKYMLAKGLDYDIDEAEKLAERMYELVYEMKFLPPGRGLWAMGSPITEERGLYAALNNCAFVSTGDQITIEDDPTMPYTFLMDASMLGVGVGFDTHAAGKINVYQPGKMKGDYEDHTEVFQVPDSREGWVESTRLLLQSYFVPNQKQIKFSYDLLRPAGTPIKGFGGVSSGYQVLAELHERLQNTLNPLIGKKLTVTSIVDLMNHIGKCVVSGNVRRTAEIAFGEPDSEEYIDLKDYEINPHRMEYGWTSNNSIFANLGMEYDNVCKRVVKNGEPGFAWLENMRDYGRMKDPPNYVDHRVMGGNPCLEQSLESFEMCCLVETFPARHENIDEYMETLKYAYLYAKVVTLGETHWERTNEVMSRNRRIGCSMSGIAQFVARNGLDELKTWCDKGYETVRGVDKELSKWMDVPESIKCTSIKPSGTVSLLAGATPGVHFPESRFYLRRIRIGHDSPLLKPLEEAGYNIEPAVDSPNDTVVVEIPVDAGDGVRTVSDVTMWEQLSLAAFLQRYWADNQVSCTITFDPETEGKDLPRALDVFQYQLKGISFLPRVPLGAYAQMPYEEIKEETYNKLVSKLKDVDFQSSLNYDATDQLTHGPDAFCDADGLCSIDDNKV